MVTGHARRVPDNEADSAWRYDTWSYIYAETHEDGTRAFTSLRLMCDVPLTDTSVTMIDCWIPAQSLDGLLPTALAMLGNLTRTNPA